MATTPTAAELPIPPIAQQTQVWCWAACAEMVFRYYGMPNVNPAGDYQCGIVGAYWYIVGGPFHPCVFNCLQCVSGIANLNEMRRLVLGYGWAANQIGIPSYQLTCSARYSPLSLEELANELDNDRPVLAGVSFSPGLVLPGVSQHLVTLVGYNAMTATPTVTVNDPYPYGLYPQIGNPYMQAGGVLVAPGRYRVPYAVLIGALRWENTLYNIR